MGETSKPVIQPLTPCAERTTRFRAFRGVGVTEEFGGQTTVHEYCPEPMRNGHQQGDNPYWNRDQQRRVSGGLVQGPDRSPLAAVVPPMERRPLLSVTDKSRLTIP
jgi:hypothetical protein